MCELVCVGLERIVETGKIDSSTKLIYIEVLISTCEEFLREGKDKGKAGLFYEQANCQLLKCKQGILNVVEASQCDRLSAKLTIFNLMLEDDISSASTSVAKMKPAVLSIILFLIVIGIVHQGLM